MAVVPGRLDLRLGSSMLFASTEHIAECPDIGPECASDTPPRPFRHHVDLFMVDTTLEVAYGLAPWLAVEVRVPYRVVDIDPRYTELDGSSKSVPNDIHHHDVTLHGLGDPWLLARFAGRSGQFLSESRVGTTVPLGTTEPDPYALGERGISHEHTQLGTGTFIPIAGVGLSYELPDFVLSASVMALFSVYENEHGFRAPSRVFGGLRATLPLASGTLRPYVAADLAHEGDERWHGAPGAEGSTQRTDLLVGGGVDWAFAERWRLGAGVRARVIQFSDSATYDYPGLLQLSISTHRGGPDSGAPERR